MRRLEVAAILLAVFALTGPVLADGSPRRVVSMNLCTDQLALYLAAPGQLVSVSDLAQDSDESVLAEEARRFPANHGLAEEIFLLHPDLVLAGTFTALATFDMLTRLGFRVERFKPEYSIADIRANILRMGRLLGRDEEARAMLASFDRELAALRSPPGPDAPVAAAYYAGGYTSGTGTLVDEIITAAGWRNLSAELGIAGTGLLPLELIVMNHPDELIGGSREREKPALAYQNYGHPALLAAVRSGVGVTDLDERYAICGTPATLEAVRRLVAERRKLAQPAKGPS